jgi:4-hydroxybenzoate polyprenyltransferase
LAKDGLSRMRTTSIVLCLTAIALGAFAWWHAGGGRVTPAEIDALSPLASFAAVGVALWIAGSDRRKQMRDSETEDAAQAKLVNVTAECQEERCSLRSGQQIWVPGASSM